MQQSEIWKWVGRVGGVVGLIGGSLAIYTFVGGRLLAFSIWGLLVMGALMSSDLRRGRETRAAAERMERIEGKVDRILTHLHIDPHLGGPDGAGPDSLNQGTTPR